MIDPGNVKRAVVRLPNWIGDAVMALPAVRLLKSALPHASLTTVGPPAVNKLYSADRAVAQQIDLILDGAVGRRRSLRQFGESLRAHDFDLGLVMPDSFSSAYLFKLAKVRQRVGYRSELRSYLLTQSFPNPGSSIHRSEKYMRLVSLATGSEEGETDFRILIPGMVAQRASEYLKEVGRFAVVCPTTRAPSRRWGRLHYVELIRRLQSELGLDIVLVGSADETETVREVGEQSGFPYLNLADQADILLSVEVMSRAEVFVGNDSGAAHLAAASGTRTVSLSGADNPAETRPLARVGRVIRREISCSPCVRNICPRRDHVNECMDLITVGEVIETVQEVLNE